MAITASARWRALEVVSDPREARRQGARDAVASLRFFAGVESDPAGRRALLKAADALEQVHGTSPGQ